MNQSSYKELNNKFLRCVKRKRVELLRQEAERFVPEACFLMFALLLALASTGMSWMAAGGTAFLTGLIGIAGLALGQYGSAARCVREFDRRAETNSRALNAYELICHDNRSEFAQVAIADGVKALAEHPSGRPRRDSFQTIRRAACIGVLLATGVIIYTPHFQRNDDTVQNTAQQEDNNMIQRSLNPHQNPRRRMPEPNSDVANSSPELLPPQLASGSLAAGSRGENAPRSGGSQNPPEGTQDRHEGNPSSGSNSETFQNATQAELALTAALPGFERSAVSGERLRRSSRKRQLRRNPESALGGSQPMLADNAPPAGRELGEKEGEGEPDNGRGGPTGEKKARGTAAMLPVTPQPDTVNGTLGPGDEMRIPEAAPQMEQRSHATPSSSVRKGVEPLAVQEFIPYAARKKTSASGE